MNEILQKSDDPICGCQHGISSVSKAKGIQMTVNDIIVLEAMTNNLNHPIRTSIARDLEHSDSDSELIKMHLVHWGVYY